MGLTEDQSPALKRLRQFIRKRQEQEERCVHKRLPPLRSVYEGDKEICPQCGKEFMRGLGDDKDKWIGSNDDYWEWRGQ